MDYGGILKKGWDITWKNKGLWLLGILSGCSTGGGNPSQGFQWQSSGQEFPAFERAFNSVPEETWILIAIGVVLLAFLIAAVMIVLSILGQAGLIAGVAKADETGSVRLGEAWKGGLPHFWRLLGLTLLLVAIVLVGALAVGIFTVATVGIGLVCLIPLFCLLIPLGLVLSGYLSLVQNGIVLGRQGVFEALGRGWDLFKANLWPVVLIAVIVWVIGLVGGLLISAPLLVAALPLLAYAVSQPNPDFSTYLPLLGCFVVYLPVLIVLGGVLKTYLSSVWTLTYRRLTGAGLAEVVVPSPS